MPEIAIHTPNGGSLMWGLLKAAQAGEEKAWEQLEAQMKTLGYDPVKGFRLAIPLFFTFRLRMPRWVIKTGVHPWPVIVDAADALHLSEGVDMQEVRQEKMLNNIFDPEGARWKAIEIGMSSLGYAPAKGGRLLVPSSVVISNELPAWAQITRRHTQPMLTRVDTGDSKGN